MTDRENGPRGILSGLLVLLLLITILSGCGQASDTSGLSGSWILDAAESGNIAVPDLTVKENRLILFLDSDGSGTLSDSITDGRIHWRYENGELFLQTGTTVMTGFVEGEALILQTQDDETSLRFLRYSNEETKEEPVLAKNEKSFLGDWYGWWKIEDSTGKMPVSWYDCCGVTETKEDGTVVLTIWDEDGSRSDPLSEVSFSLAEDGSLISLNGYFAFAEIRKGDWKLTKPDPGILIENFLHDAEGESFLATIYLRPWGERWSDSPEEQRPFYYDDWYLPLLKQGASMPDQIPWQRLEADRTKAHETKGATSDRS